MESEFKLFLNDKALEMDNLDSSAFYSELQSFSNGTRWETEIVYDDPLNPTEIASTRFQMALSVPISFSDAYAAYLALNAIFDEHLASNEDGFVFYRYSLVGYLQNVLPSMTAMNMLFAGIGVFVVLILFVDLRMALFLLLIVSMIDVHLMAWMWAFDIALDASTFIVLVMAVGLTVDYIIHITHSVVEAQPEGDISKMSRREIYAEKVKMTLNGMGLSVWCVLDDMSSVPLIFYFFCVHSVHLQQGRPDHVHRSGRFGIQPIRSFSCLLQNDDWNHSHCSCSRSHFGADIVGEIRIHLFQTKRSRSRNKSR